MKRIARVFLILCLAGAMVFGFAGLAFAAAVVQGGMTTISVRDKGPDGVNLFIPVPAMLFDLGAGIATLAMPADERAELRRELAPLAPALRQISRDLSDCPNVELIKVTTKKETVSIRKQGRSLKIEVHSPEADIRISAPADLLDRVLGILA